MLDFLRRLIAIPTENPPGSFYEDCARLIGRRLRSLGYRVQYVAAEGLREHSPRHPRLNAIGRRGSRRPLLHFNGHFDVVPAGQGWTMDPFGGERRAGRVYGRGSSDQKSGIAASIYAVEALRRAGIDVAGSVEQSATVDEESGGFAGVGYLCRQGRIRAQHTDFVIITEPLNVDCVCLGHRGVYWFELTTMGRAGHGSMPGLAVNAVDLMNRFMRAVDEDLRPLLAERLTSEPVRPRGSRQPSININAISGGQFDNQNWPSPLVVDRCTAVFDRRFNPEEALPEVKGEIVQLLERLSAEDSRFRYQLRDVMSFAPTLTPTDGRTARVLAGAVADVLGRPADFVVSPGTFDQKHVVNRAHVLECLAYGPGILEQAHQPDEYVLEADVIAAAKVMALATLRLVGVEG